MQRQPARSFGIVLLTSLFIAPLSSAAEPTPPPAADQAKLPEVRLAVIIVVDQLRGDLLARYGRWLGPDGFNRLLKTGAYYPNAYFTYGANSTAVGHATIATGRLPRQHGIINNEWFVDPELKEAQQTAYDRDARPVGATPEEGAKGYSPRFLLGSTIGDQLKLADRRSRVFSVSLKPRAAIMLGGQNPDGCFWWDRTTGKFATSTWYTAQLPPYVAELNQQRAADKLINTVWEPLLPSSAYAGCRPVDPKWIQYDYGVGAAFPHRLTRLEGKPGTRPYDSIYAAPAGNDLVLTLATRILANEKLGQGPATDLLSVSFSSNDVVGHIFGPNSAEYMDVTLRTDRQIAELLKRIDQAVGLDRCLIALTGDHGVKEIPAVADQMKLGAQYLDRERVLDELNKLLPEQFGPLENNKPYVLGITPPWVWLDHSFAEWPVEKQQEVMYAAGQYLINVPGVAFVFTAAELEDAPPLKEDRARWLAWRSYCPGRSGQIYFSLEPFWYETDKAGATGHGSDQASDRHVPIILAGHGIRHGRFVRTVDPVDIAPSLATGLGIEPPNNFAGEVLHEAFSN